MDTTLIEMLEKFGLSELEAKVYLSTLLSKKGSAYDISKNLKTRTTVYTVLEKLKQKGLISLTTSKNKKIYRAKDITTFIEEKRNETDIISRNILTLSARLLTLKHTGIKIFKGEDELLVGLKYGIVRGEPLCKSMLYCIYPSSSKITISPKDTLYYNFNIELTKYHCQKIILSDTHVRSEYKKLDENLGFIRHTRDHQMLKDLSKLAIGLEVLEVSSIIKIFFYKENVILVIENKELSQFIITYLKMLIVDSNE